MSESPDSRPPRRIDAAAKAAFLAALSAGARREDAAAEAGFSLMGFYGARHRDPEFAAGWTEALAAAPAAERRADFLAHFAISGDACAAAEGAGVSVSTVHRHRRLDREFWEAYFEALDQAYFFLRAEAVQLQLEAQARYRGAIDSAEAGPAARACPHCGRSDDPAADFDRVLKLLARYERKPRGVESRFTPGGRRQRWTFDESMALLDKKLRALGLRRERERAAAKPQVSSAQQANTDGARPADRSA
jgi:hypothetical protein